MAIPEVADGPLALSQQRLDDAVHALADPIPVWDHGTCRWSDSLYTRLRGALRGRKGGGGIRMVAGSRAPCSVAALDLLVAVDSCTERWEPGKGTAVDRLHRLTGRGWRPQDSATMDDISSQIERWTVDAAKLVGDAAVSVALRLPCPRCGARFAYRRTSGGETVRTDALKVSEDGCECAACKAVWQPAEFHWLARLLGCEALPSV
ncbi:MAG: hypothetical protein AB7G47_13190 [Mycolicibacterium sp.]|uniref:DUF7341 domain-containing protein n=1 Tax=Mycolicibacterium sp. TaxID=2320850 RepID=UPI003D141E93